MNQYIKLIINVFVCFIYNLTFAYIPFDGTVHIYGETRIPIFHFAQKIIKVKFSTTKVILRSQSHYLFTG